MAEQYRKYLNSDWGLSPIDGSSGCGNLKGIPPPREGPSDEQSCPAQETYTSFR